MKKREIRELQQKKIEELVAQLQALKLEVEKLYLDMSLGKLKNTAQVKEKRKDIARIATVLRQKQLVPLEPLPSENIALSGTQTEEEKEDKK